MELAKPRIDVGVFTDRLEPMLAFWRDVVGLEFEELLPLGNGAEQHRFGMNGSVFKLNHSPAPLPSYAARSGYRELLIARPGLKEARSLVDPDLNAVTLVPPGEQGVDGIGVRLGVRDEAAFRRFYGEALELEARGSNAYVCGDSLLMFAHDPEAVRTEEMRGPNYRYITIQVRNVDDEYAGIVARGGEGAREPVTLGDVARICFVRDPDGNWIEVSQRKSLVGTLE